MSSFSMSSNSTFPEKTVLCPLPLISDSRCGFRKEVFDKYLEGNKGMLVKGCKGMRRFP